MSQKKPSIPRPTSSRLVAPINRTATATAVSNTNLANTSALSDCSSISSIRSSASSLVGNRASGPLHQSNSVNRLDKITINNDLPRSATTMTDSTEKLDTGHNMSTSSCNSIGSISMARSTSLSSRTASTSSKTISNRPPFSTSFNNNDSSRSTATVAAAGDSSSADLVKKIEVNRLDPQSTPSPSPLLPIHKSDCQPFTCFEKGFG